MADSQQTPWQRLAFLNPPDEVQDWRMVLLYDAAVDNGLLDALPGSAADVAAALGLVPHAVRIVLDGLALWDIVVVDDEEMYAIGPAVPDADGRAILRHHAGGIRRYGAITERLRSVASPTTGMPRKAMEIMLDAMSVRGRESARGAVDACLAMAPEAASLLDLGGGHGQFAAEFFRRGLRAVMQERPEVVDLVRGKGWLAGTDVELFGGDFFETTPDEAFDIVFCAGVVYTMDGERVVRLLRKVRPLLAPGGLLAVHTFLRGTDELTTLFSAQMLAVVAGGPHSEQDLLAWFDDAGYRSLGTRRLQRRPEWMLFATPDSTG